MPTFKDLRIWQEATMERRGYIDIGLSERLFQDYQELIRGLNAYINYIKSKRGDLK